MFNYQYPTSYRAALLKRRSRYASLYVAMLFLSVVIVSAALDYTLYR